MQVLGMTITESVGLIQKQKTHLLSTKKPAHPRGENRKNGWLKTLLFIIPPRNDSRSW
jgi:hypothetical protein